MLYVGNVKIRVDAYDLTTNTVYEFQGDHWHGNLEKYESSKINSNNKKTFSELNTKTEQKRELIKNAGYNLIEIRESNFLRKHV